MLTRNREAIRRQKLERVRKSAVTPASESIVYVAPDCTDSAVKKRVQGLLALGHDVTTFSFRRDRYNVGSACPWKNVELGKSQERRLVSRLFSVFRALGIIMRHRTLWRQATMIYARNLDLALLALAGRLLNGSKTPVVYEILDIHPLLASPGLKGAIARWLERRVLARCRLLVISSPAYLTQYFQPRQNYHGPSYLLENKWSPSGVFQGNRLLPIPNCAPTPRWVIGWFGNIRCSRSVEILTQVADALPDKVTIYLRGCTSLLDSSILQRAMHSRPNLVFAGEYNAPDELPEIYAQVHFNWCADFSDGPNSAWLIPNRIYEGGYFGVPAIAIDGHHTGAYVGQHGLGMVLQEPYADELVKFLTNLDADAYQQLRRHIESLPESQFVDAGELSQLVRMGTQHA
ncbi:MAG: hypothetical protein KDA60_07340 [Planctomycetales bacterium]|nr:hypothetical protein [Planctomycetales bacterium]